MKLIVGLGNPGKEYENTRHNAGFLVVDRLLEKLNVTLDRKKFKGLYTITTYKGEKILILKPQTYMNLSGECVSQIVSYYDIDHKDILVIHDDLDLPLGTLRLRTRGSSGGQKGMENILSLLDDTTIDRIRVGISHDKNYDTKDYVLGRFHDEEAKLFDEVTGKAADAVIYALDNGFSKAMNLYNQKPDKEKE